MDEMVLEAQLWVNDTYSGITGYVPAPTTGQTGWSTMYALTRALQIELGIGTPADNFGDGTATAYRQWGEMEMGSVPVDQKGINIVKILQSAMYCKGYGPGAINGTFGEGTKREVVKLQTNAGLPIRDGKVYDYIFKAFLIMDAYVQVPDGDPRIREMQRDLNYNYYTTSGVQPTDGQYQRGTNRALIYGIQTEEDIDPEQQTGSVGPATTERLPTLKVGSNGVFVKLLQYALYVNGYDSGVFDGIYGNGMKNTVIEFQNFVALTADGIAGKQTWLSLLQSKGDPNRKGTACDCVTEITYPRAQALKSAGYKTVGRYLVNVVEGIDKKIKPNELDVIFNNGLTVFPIYQTVGNEAKYFNQTQGKADVQDAYTAAKNYGFKSGTTIYFAVDFDALGNEITNNILPYFQGINQQMNYLDSYYEIGVYGPRNVCTQVSDRGWAATSFVSDMSTGFSANLGYPLPTNWAFDQISTINIGSGDSLIKIDNNIKSGRDHGVSRIEVSDNFNQEFYKQLGQIQLLALEYADRNIEDANYLTTNYYRRGRYEGVSWTMTSGDFNEDFETFVNNSIGDNSFVMETDPVSKSDIIDSPHLLATLSALLYNTLPIVEDSTTDFAGWGGDLFTATANIFENREKDKYTGNLNERTYQAARDYIGSKILKSNLSYSDLLADIDAINIAYILKMDRTKPILTAVNEYNESEVFTRFSHFYQNRFNGNESALRNNAEKIMIGDNDYWAIRQALRGSMGMNVPYYSDEEGQIIAGAFVDIVLEKVQSE
ncbi:glycoside hydrolase domain-containing protein [Sporolactobacillus terrae]|uniref:glycoside hydrolase domain-containing protein n=1 Tax=Sporolactobacillus terrae TaxID=269673 RepID=UPI001CC17477|nr:glycoside hydrolase domain-containing protein [Sporolactobacillus terrae]UAK15805.1 DUF1906 domain-containing protein [Sporolactobacillus terrae]